MMMKRGGGVQLLLSKEAEIFIIYVNRPSQVYKDLKCVGVRWCPSVSSSSVCTVNISG
jgi:hypothetical protein